MINQKLIHGRDFRHANFAPQNDRWSARLGATGSIGVGRVVRAAGDGYTLSIGTVSTHVLTGALYALPYDLLKDLTPVARLAIEPLVIVAKKSMPAKDLKELIAWLKANPDKASQGTAGVGNLY
jgi:tripartite-type tricarboxylate transporter receptor subunit TctC